MTDGFGPRFSIGAVAGPVVAALLAGSTAYAVQQDSFDTDDPAAGETATAPPHRDKALVSLHRAVREEERRLDRLRGDLHRTQQATRRTLAAAREVGSDASAGWVPPVSVGSGSPGSGGSGSSSSSGRSTASGSQPSTHSSSGASGA